MNQKSPVYSYASSISREGSVGSMTSDRQEGLVRPDGTFCSSRHAECSLQRMKSLFVNRQLTDVVLKVENLRIPAHRLVLSAASDYFAAMFTNDLREAFQQEVELQAVNAEALQALIYYCYTGEIDIHEDTVETLLSTANLLQLSEVVEACCKFMMCRLNPSNCIGICLFAESQSCVQLHNVAYNYIMGLNRTGKPGNKIFSRKSQGICKYCGICLLLLVLFDPNTSLNLVWYREVYKNWSNQTRFVFIADHVEANPLFREDRMCQDLIMEALKYHLLPERRSMLQSPRTKPRKSTVGSLYIIGGMDGHKGSTSIQKYDLRTNSWSHFSNMNGRRLQFGAAVLDNKLYIVGGRDGLKTLNTVECYDLKTKSWSGVPAMSTHRHGLGVGVLEGPMYAVGGHDGWSYLNTVERWDPQSHQWSYVAPMNTQRSTAGIAILNNRLYAVGGRDGSSCLRCVECFDPHTNKWTLCAPMMKRRGGVGVGVANEYLFALGGHDAPAVNPSASRFDCVERYDPKTDTWTSVAPMSVRRDAIGVSLLGHKLFAIGGYDGQNYLNLVQTYDPQSNEWEEV
ncbi:kelch-like protein 5 [Centruroides sculpturatus]|uniref:kelch-like protein 5 n=1 Tax=Centruroides sculpturatus TaxID=218467 RepID=UPI000C6EDE15|nr:kelch-like protein 5 [Centruroides sculpturatus]